MQVQPGRLDELGLEQREMALTYLLERLHVYQASAGGMHAVASGAAMFTPPMGPAAAGLGGREGQIPGGIALPPIVTPPQYQAQGGAARGRGPVGVGLGDAGWAGGELSPLSRGSLRRPEEGSPTAVEGEEDQPSAEQLMGKLLTDVRPWGGKAKDTVRTGKNKGSTFLKKGAGIHAGAVSSSVSYSQRFAA